MVDLARYRALVTPKKPRMPWKRTPEEDARIYGPVAFREWLHQQPCAVCGWTGRVEQAHARTGGTGRKGDWTETFPSCVSTIGIERRPAIGGGFRATQVVIEGCHAELHRIGVKTFEKAHNVKLLDLAALTQSRYAQYQQSPVTEHGANE